MDSERVSAAAAPYTELQKVDILMGAGATADNELSATDSYIRSIVRPTMFLHRSIVIHFTDASRVDGS